MQISAEARTNCVTPERRASRAVSADRVRLAAFALAALTLGLWAMNVVRQSQLRVADAGLGFYAIAGAAGAVVAIVVARQPGRERLALLMTVWLLLTVLDDLGVDWPASRSAATLWMLAHGLVP